MSKAKLVPVEEVSDDVKPQIDDNNDSLSWMAKFTNIMFQKAWIRIVYLVIALIACTSDVVFNWIIYRDAVYQMPGLVFGSFHQSLLIPMLAFNLIALITFGLQTVVLINLYWAERDTWMLLDTVTLVALLSSGLPLCIINTFLAACRESAVSVGLLAKASIFLILLAIRCICCLCNFLNASKNDDGYLEVDSSKIPEVNKESMEREDEKNPLSKQSEDGRAIFCCDIKNIKCLRRLWCAIRVFLIFALVIMLLCNLMIFKFTLVQTYNGYLEWKRVQPGLVLSSLPDTMAERYFSNVDIFFPYSLLEMSSKKEKNNPDAWIRVVGLVDLFAARKNNEDLTFEIILDKKEPKTLIYTLSKDDAVNNSTTRETCWRQIVDKKDYFKEITCSNDELGISDAAEKWRIKLNYKPPTTKRHLGEIVYRALYSTNKNEIMVPAKLEMSYFRNTLKQQLRLNNKTLAEHQDGSTWLEGPFHPVDLNLLSNTYGKVYKVRQGDLIPIQKIWRTGFAMCPSNAPTQPIWQVDLNSMRHVE